MKRVTFVGAPGSKYLYSMVADGLVDLWSDVTEVENLGGILLYRADLVTETDGSTRIILDATGEVLKHLEGPVYIAEKLGKPETPIKNAVWKSS